MGRFKINYIRCFEAIFIKPTQRIISLQMSSSRWGSFSLLVSIAQFFLSLGISVLGISIVRGEVDMPTWVWIAFWVTFSIGMVGGLLAFVFALYFLLTQDNTAEAKENRRRDYRIKRVVMLSERINKRLGKRGN